jgi:hypothetical protein
MTYGEIEFLDEPVAPPDEDAPSERPHTPLGAVAVVGWIAAAVLSVLAPFQALYRVGQPADGDNQAFRLSVDGWGRQRLNAGFTTEGHGPRLGVTLCVCAALFVALAALRLWTYLTTADAAHTARVAQIRRALAVGSIAATALLAGALASIELDVQAALDSFTHIPADAEPTQPAIHASHGPFLWVSLAALACAIAATTAQILSLRKPGPR